MVPLPVPDGVMVHQAASLAADHAELEVTVKLVFPAGAVTFWLGGVTANVGAVPPCVTVIVTGVAPEAETVILATREAAPPFAAYVAVSVPFPVPEGVTVHHAASLIADQAAEVVTVKGVVPAG